MTPNWVKVYAQGVILKYRQVTSSNQDLPDVIIIGAQKSGTSSLYAYLSQHPQILPAFKKEVHFFDGGLDPRVDNFKKGRSWYCSHFPSKKNNDSQKTFEASPLYIFNPLTPQRIAELTQEVRIIVLLRNPTERAISHYFHEKRTGRETLDIYEALQKEDRRLDPVIEKKDYKNNVFIHHSYKRRGLYKEQLERYLEYFSREQILVMASEEFFAKPDICLRRVFEFVGVDPEYKVGNVTPRNVANNRSELAPDVYEYLNSFFRPHNQELYDIVKEDYGW